MPSREELLARLGIAPEKVTRKGKVESVEVKKTSVTIENIPPGSEDEDFEPGTEINAMEVDTWDRRKGTEILAKHKDEIDQALNFNSQSVDKVDMTDLFNLVFAYDPAMKELSEMQDGRPKDRHKFITESMDSPDLHSLRHKTAMNFKESETAAVELAKEFGALSSTDLDPSTPEGLAALAFAVDGALAKAMEMVELQELTEAVFGACAGPEHAENPAEAEKLKAETIQRIFEKIQSNPWLREFMKLAGRYRETAKAKQRSRTRPGHEEVTGVTQGNNLERLLPTEMMYLANPKTQPMAMRRFMENQMGMYEIQSPNPKGEGPIIFCVDGTGSMSGSPIQNAKSMALAGWYIAQSQKRWCMLVEFGSDREVGHTVIWSPPNSKGPTCTVDQVLTWVEHFYNAGGTSYKVPLVDIPAIWGSDLGIPAGKTDMVIISDGLVSIPQIMADNFVAWKQQNKVSLFTLLLGGCAAESAKNKQIIQVSDRIFDMDKLDIASEAVDACLSI